MFTRTMVRRRDHVITTRRQRTWPWVLVALLFIVALFGWADHLDQKSQAQHEALLAEHEAQRISAYELGRSKGHAEMMASARAAWQSAHAEAERCRRQP